MVPGSDGARLLEEWVVDLLMESLGELFSELLSELPCLVLSELLSELLFGLLSELLSEQFSDRLAELPSEPLADRLLLAVVLGIGGQRGCSAWQNPARPAGALDRLKAWDRGDRLSSCAGTRCFADH